MTNRKEACSAKIEHISLQDLPLSCPLPNQVLWNAHPRVYLAIEDSPEGKIDCPYCSTCYILKEA